MDDSAVDMRIGESHRPLRVVVCDEIRRRILQHEYPPGTRLIEEHIAEELGVSRNPVREALRALEAESFVEIVPRRGAVVAELSTDESEELFEILLHLEVMAAQFAARKASPEHARALLDIVERAEHAVEAGDLTKTAEYNTEFHTTVLDLAGNDHLTSILTQIRDRNRAFSHIGPSAVARLSWVFGHDDGGRGRQATREHRELANAILRGDVAQVADVVMHHIEASRVAYESGTAPSGDGRATTHAPPG